MILERQPRQAIRSAFRPSVRPSVHPTVRPTACPSASPSARPSDRASVRPTVRPSVRSSDLPSDRPSVKVYIILHAENIRLSTTLLAELKFMIQIPGKFSKFPAVVSFSPNREGGGIGRRAAGRDACKRNVRYLKPIDYYKSSVGY